MDRLRACDKPVLFDFAVYNPLEDPLTHTKIRSCTVENAVIANDFTVPEIYRMSSTLTNSEKQNTANPACISATETKATMEFMNLSSNPLPKPTLLGLLPEVRTFLQNKEACQSKLIFGYYREAVVGDFTGAAIDNHATAPFVIEKLIIRYASFSGLQSLTSSDC
jgi:chitinase